MLFRSEGPSFNIFSYKSKLGPSNIPSFDLYEKILKEAIGVKLIASGGISTFDELPKLAELGCEGTIIGKAIYEGRITLKQLENYILNK